MAFTKTTWNCGCTIHNSMIGFGERQWNVLIKNQTFWLDERNRRALRVEITRLNIDRGTLQIWKWQIASSCQMCFLSTSTVNPLSCLVSGWMSCWGVNFQQYQYEQGRFSNIRTGNYNHSYFTNALVQTITAVLISHTSWNNNAREGEGGV